MDGEVAKGKLVNVRDGNTKAEAEQSDIAKSTSFIWSRSMHSIKQSVLWKDISLELRLRGTPSKRESRALTWSNRLLDFGLPKGKK